MNPALAMPLQGVQALDASAGTGKTYSIALLHLRLVLSGVPVERILVTTFTEAAASELRDRLRRRLHDAREGLTVPPRDENLAGILDVARASSPDEVLRARLDQAIACFDLAPVRTIHGFCHLLLRDYALELGADSEEALAASDPSLDRLAGDYLAARRMDTAAGEGPELDLNDLKRIAAHIREYGLTAPPATSLARARRQAENEWREQRENAVAGAAEAWRNERAALEAGLRAMVEQEQLAADVFESITKSGGRSWTKLTNALKAVDETLVISGDPLTWRLSGPARKLLPDDLLKAVRPGEEAAVRAWMEGFVFFPAWSRVAALPAFEQIAKTAETRHAVIAFIQTVTGQPRRPPALFSDLINAVYDHLDHPFFTAAVRERFDAVMVDECQDTDARQIEIFRRLFSCPEWLDAAGLTRCLVWVGDPKQSIYRFRGADIDTYLRAKNDAGEGLPLDKNFRSDAPLVEAVNALFGGPIPGRSVFAAEIPYAVSSAHAGSRLSIAGAAVDVPALCWHTWNAEREPPAKTRLLAPALQDCAAAIAALLQSNLHLERENANGEKRRTPVAPGDLAVLAPRRRELEMMRRELLRRGIPAAYRTDQSVYASDEARDVMLLLEALSAPRPGALRAALATPLFGGDLTAAAALDADRLAEAQGRFAEWRTALERDGFLTMMMRILRASGEADALTRLAGLEDGERMLTNYLQLAELLQEAWLVDHARRPEALKDVLGRAMADAAEDEGGDDDAALRLETDAPAVMLATIHGSKGLQYPIVFLPTLWAGTTFREPPCLVRHEDGGGARLVLPGDPEWEAAVREEERQEEAQRLRVMYVALTRARHQVHVWWGRVKGKEHLAFARLLWENPEGFALRADEDCEAAFAAAMDRRPGVRWEKINRGEIPAWSRGPRVVGSDSGPAEEPTLRLGTWSREALTAAPLHASYSALIRRADEADRFEDEFSYEPEALPAEEAPSATTPETDDVLAPLEAGNILGDRVHHAFEQAAFAANAASAGERFVAVLAADLPGLVRTVRRAAAPGDVTPRLDARGIAAELWRRCAGARLDDGTTTLADLFQGPRAAEWAYLLPRHEGLTPASLAAALRRHAGDSPWAHPGYADRIAVLGFPPGRGYFDGVIDLLAQQPDRRWRLVDYKTNRLERYDTERMTEAMADCHYLLQGLLYAVAAQRWLRRRCPGWSYNRDFAGVTYLFVRGADVGSWNGVWSAKPAEALVLAVEALLCEPESRGGGTAS
ncbi:MAG TPA: UvrD-helicase domain-containing protein [Kiritimatiellia bacterium]|nr:UvrD-helicase domain-containing protein [Kiritimatiellia bacterium]HMO99168.1 UvrD-helicase domain-containing protein [Kiritimatiellia bacterium]HMP95755.1 UvrD-helicase domain-containing protein [Kiritimatiellia bacterium]